MVKNDKKYQFYFLRDGPVNRRNIVIMNFSWVNNILPER